MRHDARQALRKELAPENMFFIKPDVRSCLHEVRELIPVQPFNPDKTPFYTVEAPRRPSNIVSRAFLEVLPDPMPFLRHLESLLISKQGSVDPSESAYVNMPLGGKAPGRGQKWLSSFCSWELEALRKFGPMSGRVPGAPLNVNLVRNKPDLVFNERLTKRILAPLVNRAKAVLRRAVFERDTRFFSPPAGTNHGYPSWSKEASDLDYHFFLAASVRGSDFSHIERLFGKAYASLYTRAGGIKKYQRHWHLVAGTSDRWASDTESVGVATRFRAVYGYPAFLSLCVRPIAKACHVARMQYAPNFLTNHNYYVERSSSYSFVTAFDLKGFDTTVSIQLLRLINSLYEDELGLLQADELPEKFAHLRPIFGLRGPLGEKLFYTMDREGTLDSGNPWTSTPYGQEIAHLLQWHIAIAHLGEEAAFAGEGRIWTYQGLGDDNLTYGNQPLDPNLCTQVALKMGLELGFEAPAFLARFMAPPDIRKLIANAFGQPTSKVVITDDVVASGDHITFGRVSTWLRARFFPEREPASPKLAKMGFLDSIFKIVSSPLFRLVEPLIEAVLSRLDLGSLSTVHATREALREALTPFEASTRLSELAKNNHLPLEEDNYHFSDEQIKSFLAKEVTPSEVERNLRTQQLLEDFRSSYRGKLDPSATLGSSLDDSGLTANHDED